jgi:DNA-directed RNA polymerase subunit F
MSDMKIIVEEPISSVDLFEQLNELKKKNKELNQKAKRTLEYLSAIGIPKPKEANELKNKIIGLNIPRLKERHINKIIDIMPKDIDSLKVLFSGENITIKQEDLNKILSLIK